MRGGPVNLPSTGDGLGSCLVGAGGAGPAQPSHLLLSPQASGTGRRGSSSLTERTSVSVAP